MNEDLYRQFDARVLAMEEETGMSFITRSEQRGVEQGLARALLAVLEARFGPVPQAVIQGVRLVPGEALEELARRAAVVGSLAEFEEAMAAEG